MMDLQSCKLNMCHSQSYQYLHSLIICAIVVNVRIATDCPSMSSESLANEDRLRRYGTTWESVRPPCMCVCVCVCVCVCD